MEAEGRPWVGLHRWVVDRSEAVGVEWRGSWRINAVVKRLLAQHGGGLRVSGSALALVVAAAEEHRAARESSADFR
jgi:hypothetical protein